MVRTGVASAPSPILAAKTVTIRYRVITRTQWNSKPISASRANY